VSVLRSRCRRAGAHCRRQRATDACFHVEDSGRACKVERAAGDFGPGLQRGRRLTRIERYDAGADVPPVQRGLRSGEHFDAADIEQIGCKERALAVGAVDKQAHGRLERRHIA
jgi:hypothetical protein